MMGNRSTWRRGWLFLLLVPLSPACQSDLSDDGQTDDPPPSLAADPIAYVGHGAMFDRSGEEIRPDAEFVRSVQELYLRAALARADGPQRAAFESRRREVLGDEPWDERSVLYASSALIGELIEEVNPPDAARLAGHNAVLQRSLTLPGFDEPAGAASAPFEVPAELRARLVRATASGAGAAAVQLATGNGGAAYWAECSAAGVPIPPDWGTSQWVSRGVLEDEFLSPGLEAEVFTYQSSSPEGVCFALPRSAGSTIQLLGIICLGKASSNACFWDNQEPERSFPIQKGTVVPLSRFLGGADLDKNVGGECTDCHAGENPFIIHPGTVLGQPNLDGLPLRANSWYRPLVAADWSQNPGPTNLLDGVPSQGQCTSCHTQTGPGGRFPSVSTALGGYCNVVLTKAFSRTMPPPAPGSPAYRPHFDALKAACQQPPAPPPPVSTHPTSDILWHNVSTGEWAEWLMVNGYVGAVIPLYTQDLAWQVPGIGDFNGDGTSDFLWHNVNTGEWAEWLMVDGQVGASIPLYTEPLAWQVPGIGDFNGDGTSDILWHNVNTGEWAEWLMVDGYVGASIPLYTQYLALQVSGIGDFNGDGTSDFLWHNVQTGEWTEWLMGDGYPVASIPLYTQDLAWQVPGIGDFNGDGTSDFLWHNVNTGEWAEWLMVDGYVGASIPLYTEPLELQVAGVGDFNGDGSSDLLWHNINTGEWGEWLMVNGQVGAYIPLYTEDLAWQVPGIGDFNGQ